MKKKKTFDMLNGSIWNKLILFALPLAASSILQQLFNAADVAVVGSFAGSGALAAVGANGPIINLLVNSFVGLSIGANVVIASFIGQNDEKRTCSTFFNFNVGDYWNCFIVCRILFRKTYFRVDVNTR